MLAQILTGAVSGWSPEKARKMTRYARTLCVLTLFVTVTGFVCAETRSNALIIIRNVKPSARGLDVDVQMTHVGFMGASVEKQDKTTGNWTSVIDAMYLPVPNDLKLTETAVGGTVLLPLVLPGKDQTYRLSFFSKNNQDETADFANANPLTFSGYDAPTPKPIANSINLEFSTDSLTISAKTDDKVILRASWQVTGSDTPYGLQATTNMQNPKVQLNYGALPKSSSGAFPAMDIGLFDESGSALQEAKIAVAVAANKTVTDKVKAVKDQPAASAKSTSTKFSWTDLAKTGIGALMKYFTL
jgi:hypothetical protein